MTVRLPPERKNGILDKVLKALGKERELIIPEDVYRKYGIYVYVQARREGFWRCLLRRRSKDQKTAEEILAEVKGKNIRM